MRLAWASPGCAAHALLARTGAVQTSGNAQGEQCITGPAAYTLPMRSLLLATLLLLAPAALAGGAGPRPTPLATGQVWAWTLAFQGQRATQQRLEVGSMFPIGREGVRSFRTDGGSLAVWSAAQYVAVLQNGEINTVCVVRRGTAADAWRGFALRGTADELNQRINPERRINFNPTDEDLFRVARQVNQGTCELRRLR